MKKTLFHRILYAFLIIAVLSFSGCSGSDNDQDSQTSESPEKNEHVSISLPGCSIEDARILAEGGSVSGEVRGIWIASVYNINFPSAPDLSDNELRDELDTIVASALSHNMNTIYFQVHPSSDSLYKSDIFPVSKYLFTDGVLHFDPLAYMSEICTQNNIDLFAWVNPLRVTVDPAKTEELSRKMLHPDSPGLREDLTEFFGDGKLYFNCGNEEVRTLVADVVTEIMEGYNIAGVVFDDYFYPYPANDANGVSFTFDDGDEYKASGTDMSLEDWRRDNVNRMINLCYKRVKSFGDNKKFGVAPCGIWQNDNGVNGGSDTTGLEGYSALFCDASAWISGGYIDFISPQLYWECSSRAAAFPVLAEFWDSMVSGTDVKLIISHGIYRYDNDWKNPSGELCRQIDIARSLSSYSGSMLYGYAALESNVNGAAYDTDESFLGEVYHYTASDSNKDKTQTVLFSGRFNDDKPLFINGVSVTKGHSGFFESELTLVPGTNIFTFVNGDKTVKLQIIKK